MPVVVVEDRERLASFFRRNASAHELGDLDDFDWPRTRWFGWEVDGSLQQVALLYSQPEIPVLVAIADPPAASMEPLLAAILDALPPTLYAHATAPLLATLANSEDRGLRATHAQHSVGSSSTTGSRRSR